MTPAERELMTHEEQQRQRVAREHAETLVRDVEELYGSYSDDVRERLRRFLNDGLRCRRMTYPRVGSPDQQYGEDRVLAALLPEPDGTYVDVGAAEPVELSNTSQFYRRGWRGVLVEPLPSCWAALLAQRPRDHVAPFAASDRSGYARLRVAGMVSSIRPDWPIETQLELVVETRTLENLLRPHGWLNGGCDLLSVDVEGAEREVLDGVDWPNFRPRVVCIEYRLFAPELGEDVSDRWEPVLAANGYEVAWTGRINKIFVRADDAALAQRAMVL